MRTVQCWSLAIVAATGTLVMTGCVRFAAGAPEGMIDVIAHRGASAYAPENTIAAFQAAIDQDADWFELDCALSKDGGVIVLHDDSVDRTTPGTGKVRDLTLAELRALPAGEWERWQGKGFEGARLPTLEEALDLAEGKIGVYCEIKNCDDDTAVAAAFLDMVDDECMTRAQGRHLLQLLEESGSRNLPLTRACIAAIRERKMERQVVLQSFSVIVCAIIRIEAPEIRSEILADFDQDHPERWEEKRHWARLMDADGFNVSHGIMAAKLAEEFHAEGMSTAVWTVDDRDDMRRLADAGVDAIITNRPDVCRETLVSMGKR